MNYDPSTPIEYRYLNMDTKRFVRTQTELIEGKCGGLVRAIPNYEHNQVLYAASRNHFTEAEAILLCRKIARVL